MVDQTHDYPYSTKQEYVYDGSVPQIIKIIVGLSETALHSGRIGEVRFNPGRDQRDKMEVRISEGTKNTVMIDIAVLSSSQIIRNKLQLNTLSACLL
jgi:hypothetical protein